MSSLQIHSTNPVEFLKDASVLSVRSVSIFESSLASFKDGDPMDETMG